MTDRTGGVTERTAGPTGSGGPTGPDGDGAPVPGGAVPGGAVPGGAAAATGGHGRLAGRLAGAAALIGALTVLARVAGFGRTLVFGWAVGAGGLGAIYQTANTVPNIIFEIVAGGALASLVIPLLAGPIARGDRAQVRATASALLTWTLTLLVPLAVLVALGAEPIMVALSRDGAPAGEIALGARMLRVFAPQLPLYGLGIVLTGVLQAHRRFAWPVIAPLLSSLTVMTAYLTFVVVDGRRPPLAGLDRAGEAILSVGTTLGVAVLTLCLLVPLRGTGVRLSVRWRFHAGVGPGVRAMALAGAATVTAQQVTLALVIALVNGAAPMQRGYLVLYTFAQTMYLLPWAVLAVPVATSAYPALAEAAALDEQRRYRDTAAAATRGVLLLSALGAALLAGTAVPVAAFLAGLSGNPRAGLLAGAIVAFAPGLVGYGLFALHTRALYARGAVAAAAGATVAGWAVVAAAALAAVALLPATDRVPAVAAANSLGMLVTGVLLALALRRRAGAGVLRGAGRALVTGLVAATVATLAAIAVTGPPAAATPGGWPAAVRGMLVGALVVAVFLAVAVLLDRRDVRPAVAALAARVRRAIAGRARVKEGER
jgi:putative peptidoglycan lipid II flippase